MDDIEPKSINSLNDKFKEDIFSAIGADNISDEEKGALLVKIMELIMSRSIDRALDKMTDQDKVELEKIIDQDDQDTLNDFMEEKVSDFPTIYQDEANRLRQELAIDFGK